MDEDDHKRHEVADGIQQHESHYLAGKVSTVDHSWEVPGAGKQEANLKLIIREYSKRRKDGNWYSFAFLNAKSFSSCHYFFAPEGFRCINYPEDMEYLVYGLENLPYENRLRKLWLLSL
ncbi:hypothetical protein WISP_112773 [Willisornis vidua]|uniref:Uncharacterized protein n=1 Tax=Willisornis vidua TaxID=1566151 RepID=A0ABQ9CV37_9PASS|nr:hypothetical protein WISP_112773 [Willisornis vidua]